MKHKIEFPLGPLTPEELPAGEYIAAYRDWDDGTWHGTPKIRLEFEIIEPPDYAKLIVNLWANHTMLDHRNNRRPHPESKYYTLWVLANGGPPKRGERMTPSAFQGYWRLRVRWGMKNGTLTTPCVDALLERVAGGPRT
jgi:hypothetical protein